MHRRWKILRIIIIVLRTLHKIVVRKCQSSRSHADQMLHLALWCCSDVDQTQRFTRWSNAIHSADHTRIQWTLFLYVYIYIYPEEVSSWRTKLFIGSMKCKCELYVQQFTRGSSGLSFYMCISTYIQKKCLRGERDSSSIRRNAIMSYALGRSDADPVHSFYIYIYIYIYMCPKTCIHKERDPSWVRRRYNGLLRTRQFTHRSSSLWA